MSSTLEIPADHLLHIHQEIEIDAPMATVWQAVLDEVGRNLPNAEGKTQNLKLEEWPGGRWYRDLGNNTGHFWGHVQVIKPPYLLELYGPMMMSYAAISHLQYRLTEQGGKTKLALTHRAFGERDPKHTRDGFNQGWERINQGIKERAEK